MKALRFLLVLGFALGVAFLAFAFRAGNSTLVDLDLVWLRIGNVELWSALVAAFGMGVLIGGCAGGTAWVRQRWLGRRQRKEIVRLENEVHRLRSLPVSGAAGPSEQGAVRSRLSLERS